MLAVRLARLLPSIPMFKVETAKQMPRGLTGNSSILSSRSMSLVGYLCRQNSKVSEFCSRRTITSCVATPRVNPWFLKTQSFTSLVHCNQVEILQGKTCFGVVKPSRSITVVSRLGKRKSCKSVLKRFRRVKGGYLKRWRAGKTHLMRKKSSRRRWRLRGSVLVKSRTHLRVLNKMMYKH